MTILIFSGNVAGVRHANPDLSVLHIGDEVILVREPNNPADPHAIKLQHVGAGKLGYIPRDATVVFRSAWDAGLTPKAEIFRVDPTSKEWLQIGVRASITL